MLVPLLLAILISSVVAQSGHPEFDLKFETVVLREGLVTQIECVATGELPINYTWYDQNNEDISLKNASLLILSSANGSFLVFIGSHQTHTGLYSCSATNRHGTATKFYDVTVDNVTTEEPLAITSVEVVNVTEKSVEFKVLTTGNPHSYYIRYREARDRNEQWIEVTKGKKAIVEGLLPSGLYNFWFQIEHPIGTPIGGTPDAINVTVALLPDVPEVVFWNVGNGLVEVEWITSADDHDRNTIEEYELSYNMVQRMEGRYWHADNCVITVKIPNHVCFPARHTLAGLQKGIHYEIRMRVRTKAGLGRPNVQKVYIQ